MHYAFSNKCNCIVKNFLRKTRKTTRKLQTTKNLVFFLDLVTKIIPVKAHAQVTAHPLVSCILEYLLVHECNSIKSPPTNSYEISNKGPWALIRMISVFSFFV